MIEEKEAKNKALEHKLNEEENTIKNMQTRENEELEKMMHNGTINKIRQEAMEKEGWSKRSGYKRE